ncbi:MAG TPA: translation initiation factor IF-3 [Chloroflexia bacterium]|nr:translation initiation factor IF-3 [Chloroflexia bacterium]
MTKTLRVNDRIRAREVRVIDENGEQMGIMFARDALLMARQRDLDLVEVAPNAMPPVCRLLDYGKFRYEQTKKERDSRKTQHNVVIKEVRLKPNIDEHDLDTKIKQAKRFLDEGDKVKLTVQFHGRQLTHTEIGRELLANVQQLLQNDVIIEQLPKMEGKKMSMLLAHKPVPVNKPQAPRAPRPAAEAPAPPADGGAAVTIAPVAVDGNGAAPAPTPVAAAAPAPVATTAGES